jgi:hypothetical protein
MLTGAGMIMTAGVLIIWRERQLGLERARQRKAGNRASPDAQAPARARQSASTACPCRTTAPVEALDHLAPRDLERLQAGAAPTGWRP